MEDFVILFLQGFFELMLEILLNAPLYMWPDTWDGPPWSQGPSLSAGELSSWYFDGPRWNSFWLFVVGCAVGGLSLLIYDKALISVSFLRVANLVYSPILSGLTAYAIGYLRHQDRPSHRFCYAFCFTFGLALMRFTYAHH